MNSERKGTLVDVQLSYTLSVESPAAVARSKSSEA